MSPFTKPNQLFSIYSIVETWMLPLIIGSTLLVTGMANGCKKDATDGTITTGTSFSFTEEFTDVQKLTQTKGWVIKNNSSPTPDASWVQGHDYTSTKTGSFYGFPAFSFTTAPDEFIYAGTYTSANRTNVSSWLMTPVLNIKNGDKISFYTRGETGIDVYDRLQVLMNNSGGTDAGNSYSTTGSFTITLLDINNSQASGGYPVTWTKYEYTFSGISGNVNTRIGFRYYVPVTAVSKGIAIDLFKFEVL